MEKTKTQEGPTFGPEFADNEMFEKFKEQFKDVGKMAAESLPKYEKLGEQFRAILKSHDAIESKNVKFIGMDCVAMLFRDHIKIMVVDSEQAIKMYGKVGELDEMFSNLNRKVFDIETELAQEKVLTTRLKSRKVRIFDWWIQLFTGKVSW